MKTRVAVMHGVNLDMLDRRPKEVYGDLSLSKLERQISQFAHELGLDTRFFQSNHEGEFVDELHRAADYADGLILNPGAWTHYAWALRDALEIAGAAGRRGPPLGPREPRGVAPRLGARRPRASRAWPGRASRATAPRSQHLKDAL